MKNNFKQYVKQDLPCAAKWRWSTVRLYEGETQSCHRVSGELIPKNFDFHNTKGKLKARKLMQQGIWPGHGCEYCKNLEEHGGISDRMIFNHELEEHRLPRELRKNYKAINLTPTIVEIYFSNLCNMSCIYCDSKSSSVWNNEEKKFNGNKDFPEFFTPAIDVKEKDYHQRIDQMFSWLDKNYQHLTEIHILGGEPLIQDETFKVLDFIQAREFSNLDYLFLFSNLKIERGKFKKILDQLNEFYDKKKVTNIIIVCSIDCWGKEQEYIRTGLNLDRWEENFDLLVKQYPNIGISVHNTMTNVGLKTMADLMIKKNYYQAFRNTPIYHSFSFVDSRPFMHPRIFPQGFFDHDFDRMINIANDQKSRDRLFGFKKYLNNSTFDPTQIKKLKQFLDIIDQRRNMNWRETFPWLADFDEDKHK